MTNSRYLPINTAQEQVEGRKKEWGGGGEGVTYRGQSVQPGIQHTYPLKVSNLNLLFLAGVHSTRAVTKNTEKLVLKMKYIANNRERWEMFKRGNSAHVRILGTVFHPAHAQF